jgi:hypothetical protein
MEIKYGNGKSEHGPGVEINLTGNELATAISAYLVAQGVHVSGARTIRVNGEMCDNSSIYVDPSARVIKGDSVWEGRGVIKPL